MPPRKQHTIEWLAFIGAICLLGGAGFFYLFSDSPRRASVQIEMPSHLVEAAATSPILSPSVSPRLDQTSAQSIPPGMSPTDLASLSLRELWVVYTQSPPADRQARALTAKALSNRLAQSGAGSREIHAEISQGLLDESGNLSERVGLSRILGESNTPEGLATLTAVGLGTRNSALFRAVLEDLDCIGSPGTPQHGRALAAVAQSSWEAIVPGENPTQLLYSALGKILAKVGDPGAIRFLRVEATRGGLTITALEATGSESSIAAMNASWQVRGAAIVPVLTDALSKSDPSATEFIWSGQALASLSRPEATSALIEWARIAPDLCADTAAAWIGAVRDSRSRALVRELAASGDDLQFASSRVKEAVLASANRLATR